MNLKIILSSLVIACSTVQAFASTECNMKDFTACTPDHHSYPWPRLSVKADDYTSTPSIACNLPTSNGDVVCCMRGDSGMLDHNEGQKSVLKTNIKMPLCYEYRYIVNKIVPYNSMSICRHEGLPSGNYEKYCKNCMVKSGGNDERLLKCQCLVSSSGIYIDTQIKLDVKKLDRWEAKSYVHHVPLGHEATTKLYKIKSDPILVY